MRATHTYAVLDVSAAAYDEIAAKLRDAGYEHAFDQDDGRLLIDMHGIALGRLERSGPPLGDGHRGDGDRCPENASGDFHHSYYWSDRDACYACKCGKRLLAGAEQRR